MELISAVASQRQLAVVEDCAQAIGASTRFAPAGGYGDLAAFSFYPTKNLGALGDAGAVITSNPDLAARARQLRQYGQDAEGQSRADGLNSRLDEIQAAVLRARLPGVKAKNERRRSIAAIYDSALAGTPVSPLARFPGHVHAFHLYVVRAPDRRLFIEQLTRRGVQARSHYERPIHAHPAYRRLAQGSVPLRTAERLCREVVSLPLYPELGDAEVEHVAQAAREAAEVQ
jgi:dTDP-4-amino-4,6-dideoxygalactose transaminase